MFTGLWEYYCILNGSVKPFVCGEEVECNLINCIVGNVGFEGEKNAWNKIRLYLWYCCVFKLSLQSPTVLQACNGRPGDCLPNLAPTLPTMQFSHTGTSLEAIYQITCSFLWSHKRRYTSIFIYVVVLLKTCKHTLMCTTGGVKLPFNTPKDAKTF